MLKDKLSIEQQQEILNTLFGYNFIETFDNHWCLYDEEGDEFYAMNENLAFDFSTLAGIFSYVKYKYENKGYEKCQSDIMRKLLRI